MVCPPSAVCHLVSYQYTASKKKCSDIKSMFVWVKEGAKAMTDMPVSGSKPVLTVNEFTCEKTGVKKLLSMRSIVQLKLQTHFPFSS